MEEEITYKTENGRPHETRSFGRHRHDRKELKYGLNLLRTGSSGFCFLVTVMNA
jgi:hypothetical protein